jgi:hypothetical protein
MNMIDALQRLKDAGLIVDFKTDDAGSEYSVVFQSSVPNLELRPRLKWKVWKVWSMGFWV